MVNCELSIRNACQFSAIFKNSQFTCEAKLTTNCENQWRIVNSLILSISALFKNSQFTCEAKLTVNRENQW